MIKMFTNAKYRNKLFLVKNSVDITVDKACQASIKCYNAA